MQIRKIQFDSKPQKITFTFMRLSLSTLMVQWKTLLSMKRMNWTIFKMKLHEWSLSAYTYNQALQIETRQETTKDVNTQTHFLYQIFVLTCYSSDHR